MARKIVVHLARETMAGIGDAAWLDRFATPLARWIGHRTKRPAVKNALSGTWLGHQLHPALTDVPIGAWACASLLDLSSRDEARTAARRLVGFGVVAALPAAAAGASDWSDTYGPDQRVGLVHAAGNGIATTLQLVSWVARRRSLNGVGAALSLAALGVTLASAYLGGHLTLARGIGVNHTAFEEPTAKWTDVAAVSELTEGKPLRVVADGVPVVLVMQYGVVHALSAVCTHAGGPLDEGTLDDHGRITCPWHGSEFCLADGSVARGPATVDEPAWATKNEGGRVSVRFGAG